MAEQHCLIVGFLGVFALDHDSKFHNNLVAHDKLCLSIVHILGIPWISKGKLYVQMSMI